MNSVLAQLARLSHMLGGFLLFGDLSPFAHINLDQQKDFATAFKILKTKKIMELILRARNTTLLAYIGENAPIMPNTDFTKN